MELGGGRNVLSAGDRAQSGLRRGAPVVRGVARHSGTARRGAPRNGSGARRRAPLSPIIAAFFSYIALEARQYEAAVRAAHDALELDAHAPLTQYVLGRAYAKLGDTARAIDALEAAVRVAGWFPLMEAALGYVCARAGDRERAKNILAALRQRQRTQVRRVADRHRVGPPRARGYRWGRR